MPITVENLLHYPIKGLSAQTLAQVDLHAGKGFPLDRMFGFTRHDSGFDPQNPKPLPKGRFVVLARDAALATLDTRFDADTEILSITKDGETHNFVVTSADDCARAAQLLADHVGLTANTLPSLQSAEPHRFTDVSVVSPEMMNAVSLINTDSVKAFSRDLGQDISPHRFRGNIAFSGLPAFEEFELIGRTLHIGEVQLEVVQRTRRCPATEVNLETGQRDVDVPARLKALYGHSDMGIYAHVVKGGQIKAGDTITL